MFLLFLIFFVCFLWNSLSFLISIFLEYFVFIILNSLLLNVFQNLKGFVYFFMYSLAFLFKGCPFLYVAINLFWDKLFIEFNKISLVNLFCLVILKNCFDCDMIKFNFFNKSFSKNEFIFSSMVIFSFSDIFFIIQI